MRHSGLQHAAIAIAAVLLSVQSAAPRAADQAIAQKAELCAACHGPAGVSQNPAVPSLAGQPKQFISTQLVMFREKRRQDPLMSPIAAPMSNSEINDFAGYFSVQALPASKGEAAAKLAESGRKLTDQYRCGECHTPTLRGQQHIPRLAGQQRDYLLAQLRGFRAGTRFDMDGNMTSAVQGLTEADAAILADYLSALR